MGRSSPGILGEYAGLDMDRIDLYRRPGYRLFKTLLATGCRMDCLYCPLSIHCRVERRMWDIRVLAEEFMRSYASGRVDGLFLTSTLFDDPDRVVEKQLEVVERLRRMGYRGYIHLRLMPGTSKDLVFRAAVIADRAGVNIEAPPGVFSEIAPSKGDWLNDIVRRIEWLARLKRRFRSQGLRSRWGYLSSGVDTQVMLGVLGETDIEVLEAVWRVLRAGADRVYVSGFRPYRGTPLEHRRPVARARLLAFMRAVELMRVYGLSLEDMKTIVDDRGMLPPGDPKERYAEANKHLYPVDVNTEPYERLILVPGIGPRTARRIIEARARRRLGVGDLAGIMGWRRLRRAMRYISV